METIDYDAFLAKKLKSVPHSGFEIAQSALNPNLFDFQRFIVQKALKAGKYAIFADCGLGKSLMQLSWAHEVVKHTQKPVLILTPLAVSGQTIQEGIKFGIEVSRYDSQPETGIYISNYEQLENIDCSVFSGVVLDESSILKNFEGATKKLILDSFKYTPYKLACTATPSPNDPMELGNHAEFLDVMSRNEMLAMYFVHDGGETAKWRLKGHAIKTFYQFVGTWSIMLSKPHDIGFTAKGYDLPTLNMTEFQIKTPKKENGSLFNDMAISATEFNSELRITKVPRLEEVAKIVNSSDENFIIWIKQNEEGEMLRSLIPDAVEISGSDSLERKEFLSLWFGDKNNECQCQATNLKGEKKSTNQSIGQNTMMKTKMESTQKQTNELRKGKKTTLNTEKKGNSIQENTTEKTKTSSIIEPPNNNQNGTKNEGNDTQTIKSTEINRNKTQPKPEKGGMNELIMICEDNTESQSKNTKKCLNGSNLDAQFAGQNQHSLKQNSGCTLTTAIEQEKLGDCYAQTAIKDLGNSMIAKYCSNVPLCTCCRKHKRKILISKTKILSYGLNYQNCRNQVFASLDFSFEGLYQAIRRSYRFGQKNQVNIYLITTDTMQNVIQSISQKQKQFEVMQAEMSKAVNMLLNGESPNNIYFDTKKYENEGVTLVNGDSFNLIKELGDESIDCSIFSPPFSSLYTYSNYVNDLSNCLSHDEFYQHFEFMVPELYRILKSGRHIGIHLTQLTTGIAKDGYFSVIDFRGEIIRLFQKHGFIFHGEVTIWKNPELAAIRTKNHQLLHKSTKRDSAIVRPGLADYLVIMRKPGVNKNPINNNGEGIPFEKWCKIASPVWMDIQECDTLQGWHKARENNDERHITPTQLKVIENFLTLYSNKNDVVFTPFMGIGSEVYQAVKMERKGIGFELKESYFDLAKRNIAAALLERSQKSLW